VNGQDHSPSELPAQHRKQTQTLLRQLLRNKANACHARRERYAITSRGDALNTELSESPCASIAQLPRQDVWFWLLYLRIVRPRGVMRQDAGTNCLAIRLLPHHHHARSRRRHDQRAGRYDRGTRRRPGAGRRAGGGRSCLVSRRGRVIEGFHVFWNRGPAGEVRFPYFRCSSSRREISTIGGMGGGDERTRTTCRARSHVELVSDGRERHRVGRRLRAS
jgi:hypothetical protein